MISGCNQPYRSIYLIEGHFNKYISAYLTCTVGTIPLLIVDSLLWMKMSATIPPGTKEELF